MASTLTSAGSNKVESVADHQGFSQQHKYLFTAVRWSKGTWGSIQKSTFIQSILHYSFYCTVKQIQGQWKQRKAGGYLNMMLFTFIRTNECYIRVFRSLTMHGIIIHYFWGCSTINFKVGGL